MQLVQIEGKEGNMSRGQRNGEVEMEEGIGPWVSKKRRAPEVMGATKKN